MTACRFLYALLAVTVGAFVGAISLIAVSFYWFNPSGVGDCSFNVFIMTMTILLTLAVSLGSLHPQASQISAKPMPRTYQLLLLHALGSLLMRLSSCIFFDVVWVA